MDRFNIGLDTHFYIHGNFFNINGIIIIDEDFDIEKVIKICTKEEYESRIEIIIKDNYYRALKYMNVNDILYETFFIYK